MIDLPPGALDDHAAPDVAGGSSLMRRDLLSAYVATASRLGSLLVVWGLVYRFVGTAEFAMLALARGTIVVLNCVSLGMGPALIHRAAKAAGQSSQTTESSRLCATAASPLSQLYSNALAIALLSGILGVCLTLAYAFGFERLYVVPIELHGMMWRVVLPLGIGSVLRWAGDAPGAMLQVGGRIALDNRLLAAGDLAWMASVAALVFLPLAGADKLAGVAVLYAITGGGVFAARFAAVGRRLGVYLPRRALVSRQILKPLLVFGLLVVAAQLADYLYAPADYVLIDRLLSPAAIAGYAPAVQIDSGLLLLVSGLSAVLLPKAALAHAGGSSQLVRRYYLRGTLASFALLLVASILFWLAAPWVLRLWFGNSMRATQSILPLVLVCSVVGGSSAVGRSILLAVGKVRALAISVLAAGAVNVVVSFYLVRCAHLGLEGIIWGTVIAVVGRAGIWMPWYVMRAIRASPIQ